MEMMSVLLSTEEAPICMTRAPFFRSIREGACTTVALATWLKGMVSPLVVRICMA